MMTGFSRVSFPTVLPHTLMYFCKCLSVLEGGDGNLSHALLTFSLFANITMKEMCSSGSLQRTLTSVLRRAVESQLPLRGGQIKAIKTCFLPTPSLTKTWNSSTRQSSRHDSKGIRNAHKYSPAKNPGKLAPGPSPC